MSEMKMDEKFLDWAGGQPASLPQWLRDFKAKSGIETDKQLAEFIGMATDTLSTIMCNRRAILTVQLQRIFEAAEITSDSAEYWYLLELTHRMRLDFEMTQYHNQIKTREHREFLKYKKFSEKAQYSTVGNS